MTTDIIFKLRENFLRKLLFDIIKNPNISKQLIFKGGTSLMIFYGLKRFSEDLDFNYFDLDISKIGEILIENGYIFKNEKTKFGERFILEYTNEGNFHCIIDFSKYIYKTEAKYDLQNINGVNLKVFNLSQNFAHKLCAFYERKKGRDVFDINFYLNLKIIPDFNILQERHNKNFSFFIKELLIEINKSYLEKNIVNSLNNFDYEKKSLNDFKKELINNLNKNYLNNKFDFNIFFKEEINIKKIINLIENNILIIDGNLINNKIKCNYAIINNGGNINYQTNDINKIYTYIYMNIIENQLLILDNLKLIK